MNKLLFWFFAFLCAWQTLSSPSFRTSPKKPVTLKPNWCPQPFTQNARHPPTPRTCSPATAWNKNASKSATIPARSTASTIWETKNENSDAPPTDSAPMTLAPLRLSEEESTALFTSFLIILTTFAHVWTKPTSLKPRSSSYNAGLAKIIMTACLAASVHTVRALEPDDASWEDTGKHNQDITLMSLPFALALTTAGARELLKWWHGKSLPEIKPELKTSERDALTYARAAISSAIPNQHKPKKDEKISDFIERLVKAPGRLAKTEDDIEVRHQLIKSAATLYQLLGESISQNSDLRKRLTQEEERTMALGDKVRAFDDFTRILTPDRSILTDYGLVKAKVEQLQKLADLSPLMELIPDYTGEALDTPFKMKEAIAQTARLSLGGVFDAIPKKFRPDPWESVNDIKRAVANLAKAVNRQTSALSIVPTGSAADILGLLRALWDDLPEAWRGTSQPPQSKEEYWDVLRPWYQGCVHPEDLAVHLLFDANTPWDVSIDAVDALVRRRSHHHALAPAVAPADSLFKITDVPKFSKRSEYMGYRATLQRFFDSINEPPASSFGIALNRIVTAWDADEIRRTAANWDVSALLQTPPPFPRPRTWTELKDAFLTACDSKFLELTAAPKAIKDFNNTRPKKDQKPMDFLLDFEAALALRQTAARIMKYPELSPQGITDQLIRVIPPTVRDQLRLTLLNQADPKVPEALTYEELRTPVVNIWTYMPQTPNPPARSITTFNAPANRQAPGAADQLQNRACGLRSSYSMSPQVPLTLQGALYYKKNATPEQNAAAHSRNSAAIRAGVCEACRRPRSQHPAGTIFRPVQIWRTPAHALLAAATPPALPAPPRQPSPPPGPRVEEID